MNSKSSLARRRDILKLGGFAVAGGLAGAGAWPLEMRAAGQANPRGTARNCIFIEMGGAISHVDCWDYKEYKKQPKDLDVRKIRSDLYMSKTFFPQLSDRMDQVSLVRSMRAPELVHFNGQYHTQTGRTLNVGIAKEIPAFGSIVAYELDHLRRDSDTFPGYVSTNLASGRAGSIGAGFLPTRFTGLDLDAKTIFNTFGGDNSGITHLLTERWNRLARFSEVTGGERSTLGQKADDYWTFYQDAYRLISDTRWIQAFKASEEEINRYGKDEYGLGLILAKNLVSANAGTRFVYIYDGDKWDHHAGIFDKSSNANHYYTCNRFDKGIVSLLKDLAALPGVQPNKTLLDETIIVATSEFGRSPTLNGGDGRDHYGAVYTALYAGGGTKGGRIIGKSDDTGARIVETGWTHSEQPHMDNTVATIYSAMGIDWLKTVQNTPSGRAYHYVETAPLGQSEFISNDEIADLFV